MALIARFPCEGNLTDVGKYHCSPSSTDFTVETNGKIGSCIKTGTANINLELRDLTNSGASMWDYNSKSICFGGWFKFNQTEIANVVSSYSYNSTRSTPTGVLLGYGSYGGLGLIWTGNSMSTSGSTFNTIKIAAYLRTSTVGSKNTSWATIEFDKWVHLFLIYDFDENSLSLFKDGTLFSKITVASFSDAVMQPFYLNYNGVYGGNGPSFNIPFYINDIQLYDHRLTEKEISEISKCLVIHYQMKEPTIIDKNILANYVKFPGAANNGGAYIDTGYYPNQNTYIRAWFAVDNLNAIVFGGGSPSNNDACELFVQNSIWQTNSGGDSLPCGNASSNPIELNYDYWYNLEPDYGPVFYENQAENSIMVSNTDISGDSFSSAQTLCIGGLHRGNSVTTPSSGNLTLFQFQISELDLNTYDETIIHLFKPRVDSSGVACLYDVVTKEIFYSAGAALVAPTSEEYDEEQETNITIQDYSGLNNNGIMSGKILTQKDPLIKTGFSAYFNGNNSGILVPFADCIKDANYTINFWFRRNASDGYSSKSWETLFGGQGFEIQSKRSTTNSPLIVAYSWGQSSSGGTAYTLDKWHMLTLVSSSTFTKWYLDGTLIYETSNAGKIPANNDFYIGAWHTSTSQNFKGYIADFRIYHSILNTEDVDRLYQNTVSIDRRGQIYSYNFVEEYDNIHIWPNGELNASEFLDTYIRALFKANTVVGGKNLNEI